VEAIFTFQKRQRESQNEERKAQLKNSNKEQRLKPGKKNTLCNKIAISLKLQLRSPNIMYQDGTTSTFTDGKRSVLRRQFLLAMNNGF